MGEQLFRFKQFAVDQCDCAMKVGTDGVLLGAWVDVKPDDSVLDVGTGTGLVALMLAQREVTCQIDAVELDKKCAERASVNFKNSSWSARLKLYQDDFRDFAPSVKYDLIVSNPPYFTNSNPSPVHERARARHMDSLPLEVLMTRCAHLLSEQGRLNLILPYEELNRVEALAKQHGLNLNRLTKVKGTPQAEYKRILIEVSKQSLTCIETELVIEVARHQYTKEYINLTRDFYLAM